MKSLLIVLFFSLFIAACQKADNTVVDPAKVVITITSPQAGQVFHTGDKVPIVATVTYPSELHGYEVKVTDTSSGFIIYDDAQHVHDDHFSINDTVVCTATQPIGVKLELAAVIDHDGNQSSSVLNLQFGQ